MLAAVIEDGQVGARERPDPEPGTGEVLVRVRAAGINGADLLQRQGLLPGAAGLAARHPRASSWPARWPRAGPGAARFAEGDRVMAIVGGGGQAELAVVHERAAHARARRRSTGRAAGGAPEVFTTAHDALFTQAGLQARRASARARRAPAASGPPRSSSGRAAGARVIATVRREELREEVAKLGAEAIDPEGFVDARPVRRDPRAGRRAEPPVEPAARSPRRSHRRDRRRGAAPRPSSTSAR